MKREIRRRTMPPKLGKPEKADALKQLGTHVALFGVWVAVIRITPYILHYFSDQKEEPVLKLQIPNRVNFFSFEQINSMKANIQFPLQFYDVLLK